MPVEGAVRVRALAASAGFGMTFSVYVSVSVLSSSVTAKSEPESWLQASPCATSVPPPAVFQSSAVELPTG